MDRLRAETAAIARLYRTEISLVLKMMLALNPATLISTGGIATAIWREAGLTP